MGCFHPDFSSVSSSVRAASGGVVYEYYRVPRPGLHGHLSRARQLGGHPDFAGGAEPRPRPDQRRQREVVRRERRGQLAQTLLPPAARSAHHARWAQHFSVSLSYLRQSSRLLFLTPSIESRFSSLSASREVFPLSPPIARCLLSLRQSRAVSPLFPPIASRFVRHVMLASRPTSVVPFCSSLLH